MRFADRTHAGEAFVSRIQEKRLPAQLVIGLARGGVAVARPIARSLTLPLDVLVVKKISSPYNPELAIGAVAPDGVVFVDWRGAHRTGADEAYINEETSRRQADVRQRMIRYRKGKKPPDVRGRDVVLVDDGAATGATIEAAIQWLKAKKAKRITVALPVAAPDVQAKIAPEVDALEVLETPQEMGSVGEFYEKFPQLTDEEVVKLLT